MDLNQICPKCSSLISSGSLYCPHCGAKLRESLPSLPTEIASYLVSFLLPPFGLGYFFRYRSMNDARAKRIAWGSAILTVVSVILTIWVFAAFMQSIGKQYDAILNSGNLQSLEGL